VSYYACKYDNFVRFIHVCCKWLHLVQEINVQECNIHRNYKQISKLQTKYLQYYITFPLKCLLQYYPGSMHRSKNSSVLSEIIFHVGCSLKIRRTMQTVEESLCGRTAPHRQELTVGEDVIYWAHFWLAAISGNRSGQDTHKYRFESSDLPQHALTLSKHKLFRQGIIVCYCLFGVVFSV
jgi:hypothetical protein